MVETTVTVAAGFAPVTDRNGNVRNQITSRSTYDPVFSKPTTVTDAEGNTTFYVYDSLAGYSNSTHAPNVMAPNLPAGVTVTLSGLNTGNLLAVVDAENNVTKFQYSTIVDANYGKGDLKATIDPRAMRRSSCDTTFTATPRRLRTRRGIGPLAPLTSAAG